MIWSRLVLITLGTGIVVSLTDWFFAGDWIHRRYTYPEVWRQGVEARAIRVFVASYAFGWLVKLLIVAVAAGWLLR